MQREQAALGDQRSSAALACVGLRPEGCLVFMCQDCHTVLGDSLGVCGEDERLGVVACLLSSQCLPPFALPLLWDHRWFQPLHCAQDVRCSPRLVLPLQRKCFLLSFKIKNGGSGAQTEF
ncbi:hypothetical protein FKM82_016436 [Ascaphus truei]